MYNRKGIGGREGMKEVVPTVYTVHIVNHVAYILMIFVYATILLSSFGQVNAITGTSGSINMDSVLGTISYDGVNGGLNIYGDSSYINGPFNNLYIDGRFGLTSNDKDGIYDAISISLTTPHNDSASTDKDVNFKYIPISNLSQIINCSISIDGMVGAEDYSIINDSVNTLKIHNLSLGKHYWNISCSDIDGISTSDTRALTILQSTTFDNTSTDLAQVNISAVHNLTLSQSSKGKIKFSGIIDLSGGADFDNNIIIGDKTITVNSAVLPLLNRPAILTMYNVSYTSVLIWKDSSICSDCNVISLVDDTLMFDVQGFSTYTVTGTTRLYTYDSTDSTRVPINDSIIFYANYSSIADNTPIIGTCNIAFNIDGWAPTIMDYDVGSGLYFYNRTFSAIGTDDYSIDCTNNLGYDNISITDTYTVSNDLPSSFSSVIAETSESSRADSGPDSSGANISSIAGNLTEIIFDGFAVSSSWQGYYGNITGKISLRDGNGSALYNWDLALKRGEIYASRTPSIKWYNVHCADAVMLAVEDTYLGVNSSNDESLEKTFFTGRDFNTFYVGNIKINSTENCYSTNLNDATGAQNTYFAQLLLTDNNEMIYVGLIDNAIYGFDNRPHDFQMLVAENGENNDIVTTYYFFVELG